MMNIKGGTWKRRFTFCSNYKTKHKKESFTLFMTVINYIVGIFLMEIDGRIKNKMFSNERDKTQKPKKLKKVRNLKR